jgi:transcriptional regulator with XRE-family HTH domain
MIKKEFGRVLADLRRSENKVQEQVAEYSTYTNRYIQQMEAGEKQPTITTLFKLARALNTTPDKLIIPVWEKWIQAGCPEE